MKMFANDFYQYKSDMSSASFTNKPLLSNVYEVEFRKGTTDMFWREMEVVDGICKLGPIRQGQFLKKRVSESFLQGTSVVPHRLENRGIPAQKKNDILKNLSPLMPQNRRNFWQNLSISASVDLIDTQFD
jgi:hypothetical protein